MRALALLGALSLAAVARAGALGERVLSIEARLGNQPEQVIAALRPLEPEARRAGGDDLRIFLAAWGYAHGALDRPTVADAAIAELSELGDALKEPDARAAARASAFALRASMAQFSGQLNAAYGWAANAVPMVQQSSDASLQYWVFMTAGDLAATLGRLDEGLGHFQTALQAAERSGNDRRMAQAWLALTPLLLVKGDVNAALSHVEAAYKHAAAAEVGPLMLSARVMESLAAEQAGQTARQQQAHESARNLAMRLERAQPSEPASPINPQAGGPQWLSSQSNALLTLTSLQLSARNYSTARRLAERALQLAHVQHDAEASATAEISLGLAALGLGRHEEGKRLADRGLEALSHLDRKDALLLQLNRYAAQLDRSGDSASALARLREALLLENELVRRDRVSTVLALQRESSQAQQQRELDQLKHQNALQRLALDRGSSENRLTLLLVLVMAIGVAVSLLLLTRVRRANAELAARNTDLEFVSSHDRVTGLLNRRALERRAAELAQQAFYGIGLSLKRFGLILATLGHDQGDRLLYLIGRRLDAAAQAHGGTLYRLDGLSFGVILPDREAAPDDVLQALADAFNQPFVLNGQPLMVAASIGAAHKPRDGRTLPEIARCVELANDESRKWAGTHYTVYSAEMLADRHARLQLQAQLAHALERQQFALHYQAQYALGSGQLLGFEALLRWSPESGPVSPAVFVPLAEESGQIIAIGHWVLEAACRQARAWNDAGLGAPGVAVNISPRQFQHPGFLAMVTEVLQQTGVNPAQIELEITEGVVMEEAETTIALLHELRKLGLQLAIDDFGTGFASLAYLRSFPLHRLKIDQSFVRHICAEGKDAAIVQSLIQLAHSLELSVVAEGVETEAQRLCLQRWRCDIAQGYLLARPAPEASATALLQAALAKADSGWLADPVI